MAYFEVVASFILEQKDFCRAFCLGLNFTRRRANLEVGFAAKRFFGRATSRRRRSGKEGAEVTLVSHPQGKSRLGSLQRLALAFFVAAQHRRFIGRIETEANDVSELLLKEGIARQLEGAS